MKREIKEQVCGWLLTFIIVGLCWWSSMYLSGCSGAGSHNNTIVTYYRPDGSKSCVVKDRDSIDFLNFLVISKRKDIYVPTKYGYIAVGDSNTMPDPNSIKASGELAGGFVRTAAGL